MTEERIVVTIEDPQLDEYIMRLQQAMTLSNAAFGTQDITRGITKTSRGLSEVTEGLEEVSSDLPRLIQDVGAMDLPGINRELRLIIGSIPGMRQYIYLYFRLKRIQRSVGIAAGEAATLREFLLQPTMILTIIASAILVMRAVLTHLKRVKIEKQRYEEFLRRERGLSKREFDAIFGNLGGGAGARGGRDNRYWGMPG